MTWTSHGDQCLLTPIIYDYPFNFLIYCHANLRFLTLAFRLADKRTHVRGDVWIGLNDLDNRDNIWG